jgi:GTP cyclohydrolase I
VSHRSGRADDEAHAAVDILQTFDPGRPAPDRRQIESAVSDILDAVGENREREGLCAHRNRWRAYEELLRLLPT